MNDPKRLIIVLLGLVFVGVCSLGIKGHIDSSGYKKQVNYTTAIQSTQQDDFNYIIDSQQGRVLANGAFSTNTDKLARFDEMKQGYTFVKRTREHYTMHTYQTCNDQGGCTTHTYWSWDWAGSEDKYSDKISLHGREYPTNIFSFGNMLQRTNACDITEKDTDTGLFSGNHGCSENWLGGQYYYLDDNDRYYYEVVPLQFMATFLASTYGGLKPFNEEQITLENKSIDQTIKDVGKYKLISFMVMVVIFILLMIGACYLAYTWVMVDGVWSKHE